MSYTKFTPGPWEAHLIENWPFGVKVESRTGEILHQHGVCHSSQQKTRTDHDGGVGFGRRDRAEAINSVAEQVANARLIAAAPELYAALEQAYQQLRTLHIPDGPNNAALKSAEAALKAARGEA